MKNQRSTVFVLLISMSLTLMHAQDTALIKSKLMGLKFKTEDLSKIKGAVAPNLTLTESERDSTLIIVDGKKITYNDLTKLTPASISSVTILKNKSALINNTAQKSSPALQEFLSKKYAKAMLIETKKAVVTKK